MKHETFRTSAFARFLIQKNVYSYECREISSILRLKIDKVIFFGSNYSINNINKAINVLQMTNL